jgi:hypothetical protein
MKMMICQNNGNQRLCQTIFIIMIPLLTGRQLQFQNQSFQSVHKYKNRKIRYNRGLIPLSNPVN